MYLQVMCYLYVYKFVCYLLYIIGVFLSCIYDPIVDP